MPSFSFASQLKTNLKTKAKRISECGKMKAQGRGFTKSGSFPNDTAKVMITIWWKKGGVGLAHKNC